VALLGAAGTTGCASTHKGPTDRELLQQALVREAHLRGYVEGLRAREAGFAQGMSELLATGQPDGPGGQPAKGQ
jgi:hypothetical protein